MDGELVVGESGKDGETFWQKLEAVIFPLAAFFVGAGYTVAILVNNPPERVIHSPHAIILLAISISIAFFPLRSLYHRFFPVRRRHTRGDASAGPEDGDHRKNSPLS